jgi:hypothetical protein
MNIVKPLLLVASLVLWSTSSFASCGAAYCTVNTNWDEQGVWSGHGTRVDLRYEYMDQDQPRAGSRAVSVGEVPRHHDEVRTTGRSLTALIDHSFGPTWGLTVSVPWVARDHMHIHNHHGVQIPEAWELSGVGDIRVQARYHFAPSAPDDSASGWTFGLKLPTGKTDATNGSGMVAERTLQPGTGSTDVLLGAFVGGEWLATGTRWFTQMLWQQSVSTHDGFRPGNQLQINGGIQRGLTGRLEGMIQINAQFRGRDEGPSAEPADSGGRALFAAPGLGYALSRDTRIYGFVQLPLYQYVNGVQLTLSKSAVLGLSHHF